MERKRKSRSVSVRRINPQDDKRSRDQAFGGLDTASICGQLADELEAAGFDAGDWLVRCTHTLPWLFLMSVIQSQPKA